MKEIRQAIAEDQFQDLAKEANSLWAMGDQGVSEGLESSDLPAPSPRSLLDNSRERERVKGF
jgi:hypothetical protein